MQSDPDSAVVDGQSTVGAARPLHDRGNYNGHRSVENYNVNERTGDAELRLIFAWSQARSKPWVNPPDLAEFVPDARTLRFEHLTRLIRVDLTQRWIHSDLPKRLRAYCADFDELTPDAIPVGLIYDEFCIRRQSGVRVSPKDYLAEFPAQAAELAELLNVDDGDDTERQSTSPLDDFQSRTQISATPLDATQAATPPDTTELSATPLDATQLSASPPDATQAANPLDATLDGATRTADLAWTTPGAQDELEDLDAGERLEDFDLLMGLGRGAFARVFLARQRSMQRIVAVKISEDRGTEPQTLAQLDHDYIVRVFDQRVLADRGLRLLYMQYVPGGTLLNTLQAVRRTPVPQRSGQLLLDTIDVALGDKGGIEPTDSTVRQDISGLTWPETVAWLGRRLADALDHAGKNGVLHRDIKPANVLLTAEGVPKLADFNISFSDNVKGASPVAYFGGSLSYMSPEQLEACHPGKPGTAENLDTRSDLYSLAVMLWELLTDSKPFDDSSASASDGDRTTIDGLLTRRLAGVHVDADAALPPDCPSALRRVLLKCLEPDRENRWATGAELAQQFDLCLDARARNLVDPPPRSARLRLRPFTFPLMALAIGIPNAIAAVYNYQHNKALIIGDLLPEAQQRFEQITAIINGIFWPVGLVLILYFGKSILMVPPRLRRGKTVSAADIARARSDTLLFADRVVIVCFALWVMAGIAFPVSLQIAAGSVPSVAYVHFVASLVVCGAMALAYPFFLIALFTIRCLYPSYLPFGPATRRDGRALRALRRRSTVYLAIAASVPLVGVAGLTFIPSEDIPDVIGVVRILCVGGIFAFVGAYWIFRQVEGDLTALERVVAAAPEPKGAHPR